MESEGVSSGEDDDGLLDEDIPGEEDDNLLDDAELDYTEDILEETDEKHVIKNDEPESQDASHDVIESSSPVDVEEGEISSEEETTDRAASSSVKLKSRAMDRKSRLKKIHFTSKLPSSSSSSSSSSSMVCRHYLAGTCDWGKECRFYHPPRGAHGDRHLPPYPPRDILHHMGHLPEFLGPMPTGIAAAHFRPPMMPMPPHVIPAVPHPQFATPFHPVPIIPFHEPWLPPPGPRHMPPFREHYERMAVEAGKHGSQLEESATWVRLKTKVNRTDYHGDLRNKLKGVAASVDDQMDSDSDEGVMRNKKSEKKSKKKLKDDRLSDVKLKYKKIKKSHSSSHSNKRAKKGETDKKDARYSKQRDHITKKDSSSNEEDKNKSPPSKRQRKAHSEDKQKKHHSSDDECDTMPPDIGQLESSDMPTSRKKDNDFKWSFKIGDEKQRRLHEELKVVDNAIKRKIAAKRR